MEDKDILYKALKIAEKMGYKEHIKLLPLLFKKIKNPEEFVKKILYSHKNDIIFSHNFAKALWGKKLVCDASGMEYQKNYYNVTPIENWKYHLRNMALEKEPLKYLERFLND